MSERGKTEDAFSDTPYQTLIPQLRERGSHILLRCRNPGA